MIAESEARFRALVQHATDIVIVLSPRAGHEYVSPSVTSVFASPRRCVGTGFLDYLDDDEIARASSSTRSCSPPRPDRDQRVPRAQPRGDSWHWIEATWTNQLDEPAVRRHRRQPPRDHRAQAPDEATEAETRVLEQILSGAPLADVARTLLEAVERYVPHSSAIVRLLDEESRTAHLRLGADAVGRLRARHRGAGRPRRHGRGAERPRDVGRRATSPRPAARPTLQELCRASGLRTLWSLPIRSPEGDEFLGVLGVYAQRPRSRTPTSANCSSARATCSRWRSTAPSAPASSATSRCTTP